MSIVTNIKNAHHKNDGIKPKNPTFAANKWINELSITAAQASILRVIADHLDSNYIAFPGRDTIARYAKIHPDTVTRAVKKLESLGLISIEKVGHKGGGHPHNRYTLLIPESYRWKSKTTKDRIETTEDRIDTTQCRTKYPMKYPMKLQKIEIPVEERCEPEAGSPPTPKLISGKQTEEENQMETSTTEKQINPAEVFPVRFKYRQAVESATNMTSPVAFWWACVKRDRPDFYAPGKALTKKQLDRLHGVLNSSGAGINRATMMAVIEWTIRHWAVIHTRANHDNDIEDPPQNPTSTWMYNNLDFCCDYFQSTSPLKIRGW